MSIPMVHKDAPGVYEAVTPEQADVLTKSGWKRQSAVKARRTRTRNARKTAAPAPATAPAPTSESE
jgi:hypothetical protein